MPWELSTKSWKQELTKKAPGESRSPGGCKGCTCTDTGQFSASKPQSHFPPSSSTPGPALSGGWFGYTTPEPSSRGPLYLSCLVHPTAHIITWTVSLGGHLAPRPAQEPIEAPQRNPGPQSDLRGPRQKACRIPRAHSPLRF